MCSSSQSAFQTSHTALSVRLPGYSINLPVRVDPVATWRCQCNSLAVDHFSLPKRRRARISTELWSVKKSKLKRNDRRVVHQHKSDNSQWHIRLLTTSRTCTLIRHWLHTVPFDKWSEDDEWLQEDTEKGLEGRLPEGERQFDAKN